MAAASTYRILTAAASRSVLYDSSPTIGPMTVDRRVSDALGNASALDAIAATFSLGSQGMTCIFNKSRLSIET
jgi:hypothetical protein